MKMKGFPIPNPILIKAANRRQREISHCADKFNTYDAEKVREYCGKEFGHISTDDVRNRCISLRKADLLEKIRGHGPGKLTDGVPPDLSDELLEHYKSTKYRRLSEAIIILAEGRCQICNGKAIECHHRCYNHIGTEEEASDLIAVCRKCHERADRRRREEKNRRNKQNDRITKDSKLPVS